MSNPPPGPPAGPPASEGWLGWLTAIKGLTITNLLVIAALVAIAIPAYTIYRALNDEQLLDRLLSTYEEIGDQHSGCAVRHAKTRGGPDLWSVSTGFAAVGADRYAVTVILNHEPDRDALVSYCESLKLIADKMLEP